MRSALVAVIGDVAVDYTVVTDSSRAHDEKVPVTSSSWDLGGTAVNVAAQVVKLGGRARLIGDVGTDPWGGWLLERLDEHGIDASAVRQVPGRSTVVTIVHDAGAGVPDGDADRMATRSRVVYVDRGVAGHSPIPVAAASAADLVYVNYAPEAVPDLVAAGLGDRTIVGLEHWMLGTPGLTDCLPRLRAVVTNAAGLTEIRRQGIDVQTELVVTLGDQGAVLIRDDAEQRVPALAVTAVDSTGAGDAFAGALCHRLAAGAEMIDAVRYATVAGGLATQDLGAQAAQPDHVQISNALV